MNTGSPTMSVIHVFALWPKIVVGIFVMMFEASTVTVAFVAAVGTEVSSKDGAVKFLGAQSFKKKPIVLAMAGSVPGIIISVLSITLFGGAGSFFLLHEKIAALETIKTVAIALKENLVLALMFIHSSTAK